MNTEIIVKKIETAFENNKNDPEIEVEIRLGKFNGKMFDTNVGKEVFDRIFRGLSQYQGWENKKETNSEVFYRDRDSIRMTIDEDTGDQAIIQKRSMFKEDFKKIKGAPYDIRFSICKEVAQPDDMELNDMDRKRFKKRISFIRKNLSIDMTISTGDSEDMDNEDPTSYQVEFEIVKPEDVSSRNELFNIIYKINDVFKLLDNAMAGNSVKCVRMIRGLKAEGIEIMYIISMLARELRSLEKMASDLALGQSRQVVFKQARVWKNREAFVSRCLERHSSAALRAMIASIGHIDRMVKGLEAGDPWRVLQNIFLHLSGSEVIKSARVV